MCGAMAHNQQGEVPVDGRAMLKASQAGHGSSKKLSVHGPADGVQTSGAAQRRSSTELALQFSRSDSMNNSVATAASMLNIGSLNRMNSKNMDVEGKSGVKEVVTSPLPEKNFRVRTLYPVIAGRLYFTAHSSEDMTREEISTRRDLFFFSTGLHESYQPFCADYGPVNLAAVVHFCEVLHSRMTDPRLKKRPIVYYVDDQEDFLSNMAFLMGAYLVIAHQWSAEEAAIPFQGFAMSPFIPFRDATFSRSVWDLEIVECIRAVETALRVGWLDTKTFSLEKYEILDDPENGDIHQVCEKFVAFRGPQDVLGPEDQGAFPPSHYVPIFEEMEIEAVIRLNEADTYDPSPFKKAGIAHYDLYFDDCTVPPTEIVSKFLKICEKHKGLIAVHCYAGLGRTGTLIALWMMQEHQITAAEAIAWLRIVRPGSVIGPQQLFLKEVERRALAQGSSSGNGSPMAGPEATAGSSLFDELASAQLAKQVTAARKNRDANRRQ